MPTPTWATIATTWDTEPMSWDGATGDSSQALDPATLAATGGVRVTGNFSTTLAAATVAASGSVRVTGNLSATLAAATVSATGSTATFGRFATTLGAATLAAIGGARITGNFSTTLERATLFATAGLLAQGNFSVTLAPATVSASASALATGAFSTVLDGVGLSAAGVVTDPGTSIGNFAVNLDGIVRRAFGNVVTSVTATSRARIDFGAGSGRKRKKFVIPELDAQPGKGLDDIFGAPEKQLEPAPGPVAGEEASPTVVAALQSIEAARSSKQAVPEPKTVMPVENEDEEDEMLRLLLTLM